MKQPILIRPPIEKGVITQDEFNKKIKAERAAYQAMFHQKGN